MQVLTDFLSIFPDVPMERLYALIALGVVGLAGFALYVVLKVVTTLTLSRRDQ